jgi:hypothetical protein
MKWLVEANVFYENEEAIKSYLGDRVEFINTFDVWSGKIPKFSDEQRIFYGSINLGRFLSNTTDVVVWLPDKMFDYNHYAPHFGESLLNEDHVIIESAYFTKFKAKALVDFPFFVKDNAGYKNFTGRVYDEFTDADINQLYPYELLVISPKKDVGSEWRFVIKSTESHEVLTYSLYQDRGSSDIGLREYVDSLLAELTYYPTVFWTLDVCESDGAYKIVEINSLLTAGWYQCDVPLILKEVEDEVQRTLK